MDDAKTREIDIQRAILDLMSNGAVWKNAELKRKLKSLLPLTAADREVGERQSEALWEQRVNNALSRSRSNSLYAKGQVESCGWGYHRITGVGLRHTGQGG
ncbi:hypothetical protein [Novosphingobium sp. JCM 18896]|uniref:hypothetical protein n=1 Tax=Novosphingobium sp. JCM 18896 TaxID=2989731 RepID=UPI002223CB3E|nr:hypothetical protein [Novosphingobium sp. JCM 18896]MCW1430201.1 hypothetical protein [Novosphingobium sp. JCM 18896]